MSEGRPEQPVLTFSDGSVWAKGNWPEEVFLPAVRAALVREEMLEGLDEGEPHPSHVYHGWFVEDDDGYEVWWIPADADAPGAFEATYWAPRGRQIEDIM